MRRFRVHNNKCMLTSWDMYYCFFSTFMSFATYSKAFRFIITVVVQETIINEKTFIPVHCSFEFQETACSTIAGCSSLRTTVTMIIQVVTVDQLGAEVGGITHATGQILTGSMGTQIMAKG